MESLRLAPSGRVAAGDKLELSLLADDAELGGVARVEALFDLARSSRFEPKAEPLIGALHGEDGRWAVTPPADAPPGGYNILVRTVSTGLETPVLRCVFPCKSSPKKTPPPKSLKPAWPLSKALSFMAPTPLPARVSSAGEVPPKVPGQPTGPSNDTTALAQVVADKDGLFRFKQIPPGAYRVVAKGKVKNKNREAEAGVKFAITQEFSPLRIALP